MEKLVEIVFTDPAYSNIRLPVLALGAVLALLSIVTKVLDIGYKRLEKRRLEMELAAKQKPKAGQEEHGHHAPEVEEKDEANAPRMVLSEEDIITVVASAIALDFKKLSDFGRQIGSVDLVDGVRILRIFAGFYVGLLLSIPTIAGTALIAIPVFGATCHLIDAPPFNFFLVLPVLVGISALSGFRAAVKSGRIVGSQGLSDPDILQAIQVRSIRLGALLITGAPIVMVGAIYAAAYLFGYTS